MNKQYSKGVCLIAIGLVVPMSIAVATLSMPAYGGLQESYPVQFDLASKLVTGAFGTVRNDATTDWIWCNLIDGVAGCAAKSSTGYVLCASSAPHFVNGVVALNSDSVLRFKWNDSGACTSIQTWKGSPYAPKY